MSDGVGVSWSAVYGSCERRRQWQWVLRDGLGIVRIGQRQQRQRVLGEEVAEEAVEEAVAEEKEATAAGEGEWNEEEKEEENEEEKEEEKEEEARTGPPHDCCAAVPCPCPGRRPR